MNTSHPQTGAIAIILALLMIPLVALCGFDIDLGMIYNRNAEMRNIAHAIALAAAKKLNGTAAGISDASSAAASTAAALKYRNRKSAVVWSPSALRFSTSPDRAGSWVDAAGALADVQRVYYVKVDTHELGNAGNVTTALLPVLSERFRVIPSNSEVIAGRTSIDIAPLAICAMSSTPAAARNNSASVVELVEYGFRRGVGYNLMNLNPVGTTPLNFVVNPVTPPGKTGDAADFSAATVGPHACTGSLAVPRVTGDPLSISQPFPLPSLYHSLNARFDQYDLGACTANGAPPDVNIKAYDFTLMPAKLPWMMTAPGGQTAAPSTTSVLRTIADLPPPGGSASQYGPVWAYAKAVPFSNYSASVPEPAEGYATFSTAAWPSLYGGQAVKTYPPNVATPYNPGANDNFAAPAAAHGPGMRNRRVLNVPLLSCASAPSTSANVLAIGRFFMTVPATSTILAAEFAGAVPVASIKGTVGVFQ